MSNIVVSEEQILNAENIRTRLKQNLIDNGIMVSASATLEEITNLYETKLIQNGATQYISNGTQMRIIDDTVQTIVNSIPNDVSKIKFENVTSINGEKINGNVTNVYLPNLSTLSGIVFQRYGGKNLILPSVTTTGSNQPCANASNLVRFIAPKLSGFNYYYQLPTLKIVDGFNCVISNGTATSLETLIIRSDTLVSLNSSSRIPNIQEIYVPQDLLNSYKTATNWSVYADKIFKLENSDYENEDWYESTQWYQDEELSVWE